MAPSGSIDAVGTSIEVLETLGGLDGATVSTLASELGRSKSTIHRHLKTLEHHGYVTPEDNVYYVGTKALRLAASALNRYDVYPLCKSLVNELVAETGESAAVAGFDRDRAVYLYYNRTDQAVKTDARIGIRLHLHCTGTGKAILAHLPDDRRDALIEEHGLPEKTANTITDEERLYEELAEIRETGVAFDDEERLEGMRGVATPILNRETGELYGALTIAGPTRRVDDQKFRSEFPDLLRQATGMVELTLTYDR